MIEVSEEAQQEVRRRAVAAGKPEGGLRAAHDGQRAGDAPATVELSVVDGPEAADYIEDLGGVLLFLDAAALALADGGELIVNQGELEIVPRPKPAVAREAAAGATTGMRGATAKQDGTATGLVQAEKMAALRDFAAACDLRLADLPANRQGRLTGEQESGRHTIVAVLLVMALVGFVCCALLLLVRKEVRWRRVLRELPTGRVAAVNITRE